MKNFYLQFWKKLGDGVDLLGEGVDLLGEGVDLLGDGVDLLGDGGDPRSIAVGSSKTTVAQKGDQRLEIRKCDLLTYQSTYQLTWVGARDTCMSKKCQSMMGVYYIYFGICLVWCALSLALAAQTGD